MKLKTIEEHNGQIISKYEDKYNTGIQCPHCGAEMKYTNPDLILTSYPPQKHVQCFSCNYKTTILS